MLLQYVWNTSSQLLVHEFVSYKFPGAVTSSNCILLCIQKPLWLVPQCMKPQWKGFSHKCVYSTVC